MRSELAKATKTMNEFKSTTDKTLGSIKAALAGLAIGTLIKNSTEEAMKVESAVQQINRVMGESAYQFTDWAKTTARAFNLSKGEALRYGAVFSNLVSVFSADGKEVMDNTESLLKASAIIASGTGRTMEDVMTRIRSGLMGNTESIEDLGIYAQVGMIKTTKAFQQFANGKSWDQIDYQTQQQIRLFSILEQVQERFGEDVMPNTISRQLQFTMTMKNVRLALGQAFLPIYNAILPALTTLASYLEMATNYLAQFMTALFGRASGGMADAMADSMNGVSSAVSDTGDAYEKAGKQAKASVMGFDEINQLKDDSGSGAGAAGSPLGAKTSDPNGASALDAISESAKRASDALKSALEPFSKITWFPMTTALDNLKTALEPFTATLFENISFFWNNVLVPMGVWAGQELIPSAINAIAGAVTFLNGVATVFQPIGMWLWDSFLKPMGAWAADTLVTTLDILGKALAGIGTWMTDNTGVVTGMAIAVGGFMAAWEITQALAFIQMSGGVAAALGTVTAAIRAGTVAKIADKIETIALTAMYAKDFVVNVAKSVAALATQTGAWIANTVAQGAAKVAMVATSVAQWALNAALSANPIAIVVIAIAALVAAFIVLWNNNEGFRTFVLGMWDSIKTAFTTAKTVTIGVLTSLGTAFTDMMKEFKESPLGQYFTDQIDAVKEMFNGLITFISGVFSGDWKTAWEGIQGIFSGIFTSLGGTIKYPVNSIIKALNSLIGGMNKVNVDVPDWVPGIGGKSFGINIPTIPELALAKGGITNGPTTALIGDNPGGREVVSPLDDLLGMIASAVGTAVLQANQFKGNERPSDIVLKINDTEIARAISPALTKETQRIGYVALQGG